MKNKSGLGLLVLEILLSSVVAAALSRVVQGGFFVPDTLHANYLEIFAICLISQVILFGEVVLSRRKWVTRGLYAALSVVAIGVAVATATTLNPVQDTTENYFVAVVIFVVVNVLVFALGRRHTTTIMLFAVSGFLVGYIQLNYASCMTGTSLILVVSALAMTGLRSWRDVDAAAVSSKGTSTSLSVVSALAFPVGACALGCLLVFGVIMPLNPPYLTVELQTEYLAYPEEYVKTAVSPEEDPDNVQESNNVDENRDPETTSDEWQDPDAQMEIAAQSQSNRNDSQMDDDPVGGQGITALALNTQFPWLLLVVALVIVVVMLLWGVPYVVRRRRLDKIKALSPDEQVDALYQFFIERFKRLGLERPANLSAVDYANLYRARIAPFAGSQEAGSFDHLTALYVAHRYAGEQVGEGDLDALYYLYDAFYDNARRELGAFAFRTRYVAL
jgi:hypothetical protein